VDNERAANTSLGEKWELIQKSLRQLAIIIPPLFLKSTVKWKAWKLLFLLVAFSFSLSGAQVLMSYANRDMMTALSNKLPNDFYRFIAHYLAAIGIAVVIGVFYRYCEERLALLWREWITNHLLKRYFFRRAYYQLRNQEQLDNPDQRITEDARNVTATTLSLGLIFMNSTVTLFAFIGVLWSISLTLVAILCAYAAIGTILTVVIGYRLVGINYKQYEKEATLRYGVVRVRDNSESIAFFRGEARERLDLMLRLKNLVNNTMDLIGWNRNLAFFTSSYNYIALIIPLFVVAPLYFNGKVEFGIISQATGAFAQVLAALSLFIQQFERLSTYAASVTRLGDLWDAIAADNPDSEDDPEIQIEEGASLILENLSVIPPNSKKELIHSLSLNLPRKKGLLIMGASGSGKSSLLRTISGLWSSGSGVIKRPQLKNMLFLPQKPYLLQASLRENLVYPRRDELIDPKILTDVLKQVNLELLLERIDGDFEAKLDWSNILSLGEQQRLSFARLVLFKPSLAFLDEATSALDEDNENRLYTLLKTMGCAYVSVGHRSTLKVYHDSLLQLETKGKWSLGKSV